MKTDSSSYFWIDKVSHNDFLSGVLNYKKSIVLSQKSVLALKKANSYESRLQSKFLKILGGIVKNTNSIQKRFTEHAPPTEKGYSKRAKRFNFSEDLRGKDLDEELRTIQKKLRELGTVFK